MPYTVKEDAEADNPDHVDDAPGHREPSPWCKESPWVAIGLYKDYIGGYTRII